MALSGSAFILFSAALCPGGDIRAVASASAIAGRRKPAFFPARTGKAGGYRARKPDSPAGINKRKSGPGGRAKLIVSFWAVCPPSGL